MMDFNYIDIHYSMPNGTHSKWQRVTLDQASKIPFTRTDPDKYANWFCTVQHFAEPEHKDNEIEICPLPFDFDCATELERAYADVKTLVDYLVSTYEVGISSEEMMVYYSGNRGFHVTINHSVLEADPQVDLMKVYRIMAEMFYKSLHLQTLDRAVYTRRRAWRVPNTKHSKTGLYKRALTLSEFNSGIGNIKELATKPCSWIDIKSVI